MQGNKKVMLARAKRWGKYILLCIIPAIILKIRQRIRKYENFIIQEIKSPVRVPLLKRLWAMKHGFNTDRVLFYGLEKDNVHRYMPDFIHDSLLHPINGRFSPMIDDKLPVPFSLKDFPEYAPTHHYLIYDSEMIDLSRSGRNTGAYDPWKLLSLLKVNVKLILKPLAESGGAGVLLLEANGGSFCINGARCNERDVLRRLMNLEGYIVCQFEHQHQYANDLYPATTNTIRLITMRDYEAHRAFIGAWFHRVGTHQSIPVDNFAAGGLICSIDMESGIIGRALAKRADGGVQFVDRHPDTGDPISGKMIPTWDYVKSEVLRMADHLAFVPYMGWDIVITSNGFKVLEINSLPALVWQIHNPICDNPRAKAFYRQIIRKKGLTVPRWCL
jgi:hypothetical protein